MIRTFVTFRVAGDALVPDDVTRLLLVRPSDAREKGERYSTGISTITAKTGVWLFSTDHLLLSGNVSDHLALIFSVLGLNPRSTVIYQNAEERELAPITCILRLKQFLEEKSLTATMTVFWRASRTVPFPTLPGALLDLFQLIPIGIETDFDRDEETSTRRDKVA